MMVLLLASCEPCDYHRQERVEISDEGFTVFTTDNIGNLLMLDGASWDGNAESFTIRVDYGIVDRSSAVSVHVDGVEIGTIGTDITFSKVYTENGRDFTFTGMPEGRHIVLITVRDTDTATGIGSLELETDIPYSITIEEA